MNSKRQMYSISLGLIAFFNSCDIVTHDSPIGNAESVNIISDKVYIPAQPGTSTVNLNALIQTNQTVKLVIDKLPKFGEFEESQGGTGIFNYTTPFTSSKGDEFSFTVLSDKGDILKQQKVEIHSVARAEDLPCSSILAFTDNFTNVGMSGTVTLDLLANDWICSSLRPDIEITFVDGPKYGGVAQISNDNKLIYTIPATAATQKFDKFIYQIRSKSNHAIVSQTAGYINFDNTCFFSPGGANYTMPLADANALKFTPLYTAILCGSTISDVGFRIISQPLFGTVTMDDQRLLTYAPADQTRGNYNDLLVYEVCLPSGECRKSIALFNLIGTGNCQRTAVDDVFASWGYVSSYDVEANDCDRELIASLALVDLPVNGTAIIENTDLPDGSTWTPKQRIKYTPNSNMETDQLTYRICFQDGTCSQATLYLKNVR